MILIVSLQTTLPIFELKESQVRRRYSDFDWLRQELERNSKVVPLVVLLYADTYLQILVPPLPGKALGRQLPWVNEEKGLLLLAALKSLMSSCRHLC